ncbi:MAG: hypothetical protein ACR65R_05645 [Methylomicrobium sp.]
MKMSEPSDAYVHFCDLLTLAEEYFALGNFSAAVRIAQIAARYAFPGNVGLFASPRLERLLLELGQQIPDASMHGEWHRDENLRNVLHVLSYARPVGGDSRFVWRWIQEDHKSRHSVVITTQADFKGIYDVPEVLIRSVESSGGFLRMLSAPTSSPLEQACELRMLCKEMDIVVLHLFPYDIIPNLALAKGCDSVKTLFVNHSDHTFWIGASVAHFVVHLRKQSPYFLKDRRGLRPDQSPLLPTPLSCSYSSVCRVDAKRMLGYDEDAIILLTIASPFKYSCPNEIGFLDLVLPVLTKLPKAILLAVGPEREGAWQLASTQTEGRIVPLGTQWENDLLYAAADIYLDSVPFSSITSVLEAGARGISLLGYSHPNPELALLGPDAPGLDNAMELANDVGTYRNLLTQLITDAEFRRRSGKRVQTQILSLHTGDKWVNIVHDFYTRAERSNDRGCLMGCNDTFATSALNLALMQLYSSWNIHQLIRNFIGSLPYRSRLSITWRLHLIGFGLCLSNLLPPPAHGLVLVVARWAKRVIRQLGQS